MAPGGGGAAALSLVRRSRSSRGMGKILEMGSVARGTRSSNLVQLQLQAAIRQVPAENFEPGRRQLDPALEVPVRYLQPMDSAIPDLARQGGLAADDQYAGAERHLDLVELDPGQGDQDSQHLLALEDVARRLPSWCRTAAMEKLPMEALGSLHRVTGLFPHQRFKLFRHLRLPAPADIVMQSPAGKAPRHPKARRPARNRLSACER